MKKSRIRKILIVETWRMKFHPCKKRRRLWNIYFSRETRILSTKKKRKRKWIRIQTWNRTLNFKISKPKILPLKNKYPKNLSRISTSKLLRNWSIHIDDEDTRRWNYTKFIHNIPYDIITVIILSKRSIQFLEMSTLTSTSDNLTLPIAGKKKKKENSLRSPLRRGSLHNPID